MKSKFRDELISTKVRLHFDGDNLRTYFKLLDNAQSLGIPLSHFVILLSNTDVDKLKRYYSTEKSINSVSEFLNGKRKQAGEDKISQMVNEYINDENNYIIVTQKGKQVKKIKPLEINVIFPLENLARLDNIRQVFNTTRTGALTLLVNQKSFEFNNSIEINRKNKEVKEMLKKPRPNYGETVKDER